MRIAVRVASRLPAALIAGGALVLAVPSAHADDINLAAARICRRSSYCRSGSATNTGILRVVFAWYSS